MRASDLTARLVRLEESLGELDGREWSHDELIAAMVAGVASLAQLSQVFDVAEEDIRTNIMLAAAYTRLRRQEGTRRSVSPLFPVDVATEVISYPAASSLPTWSTNVPPHDPTAWRSLPRPTPSQTWAPHSFAWWARALMMKWLLGGDGGMSLRIQLDEWFSGGSPPVDINRYPDESVYRLVEPLDTVASIFDQRLLRRPTNELFWRIGTYDRFDLPEDGQEWTQVDSVSKDDCEPPVTSS